MTSPNNLKCIHFSETYFTFDTLHKHVKTEKQSCQCSVLGEMLQEPSNCACYKTSKTPGNSNNYRCYNDKDASINSSNPNRHINIHTGEEPCKSEDCEKSLNLLSNIVQDQRIDTAKKEHKQEEYDGILGLKM